MVAPIPFSADLLRRNAPASLRERNRWVTWRFVERGGKQTKCPTDPNRGGAASSTDPTTWGTFDRAIQTCEASGQAGIGFVFTADDPQLGVDLDRCIDPDTGRPKPWATAILEQLDSYSEVSPSGTGVKVFVRASKPGPRCKTGYEDGTIEIYDRDRFFTVTGQSLHDPPKNPADRQSAIDALYTQVFGPPANIPVPQPGSSNNGQVHLDDDEILRLACASRKSGAKFASLWAGRWNDHFNSHSEADSSVVFTLAFFTKDAGQIDRIFRRSGLMRDKWDERHGQQTYGEMTIAKALGTVTTRYRFRRPTRRRSIDGNGVDCVPDDSEGVVALGQREPETGRLVLSPKKTLPTARAFIEQFYFHPEGRMLHSYAGTILAWRGNRFVEIEEETICQQMQPWLHDALRYQLNRKTMSLELVGFDSNPATIRAAVQSVRAYAHLPATITPTVWLSDTSNHPDPRDLLPFSTGTLHIPSGRILSPTPALFNINALDFEYDAEAEAPERWFQLLEELWGDDRESVLLLQEWMGYCLVADTSQQKMIMLVGPRRSGKGTIGRVLCRLVGAGNVAGPTISGLAGSFGLQPLIGKSLAIVSDARFTGESVGVVVERLLCISGEDTLTVDRKFLGSVTMKLPTRFMFLTNELPRLKDASGALAGRFLVLRLTHSFYGQEDVTLTAKLMEELPGILLWAIDGLKRLRDRGHFVQPTSVLEAVREMEDLSSPALAFVRDRCVVAPGRRIGVDNLYAAWQSWCSRSGRASATNKQMFGRDLAAAVPGIIRRRGSDDIPFYEGINLKGETA